MSAKPAAPATATPEGGAKKSKKMLFIIIAAVVLAGGGGGGYVWWSKKKAAEQAAAEEADDEPQAKVAAPGTPPMFLPLEPFTANLADRDAERFAQIGISLEVPDQKAADQIKQFMPIVRNNVLLAISDKTADQLKARDGKTKLADEVQREIAVALGIEPLEPEEDAASAIKKKKKKRKPPPQPVRAVHFSTFIIQ